MKKILSFFLSIVALSVAAKNYELKSPDGDINLTVSVDKLINYEINLKGNPVIEKGILQLMVGHKILGENPKVKSSSKKSVSEKIYPVVPIKFSVIDNIYNSLLLKFKDDYSIEFRAFNDGVAYRFITDMQGAIEVNDEAFHFTLPKGSVIHCQQAEGFKTSYQEIYSHLNLEEWNDSGEKLTLLPLLLELPENRKVLISESALTDYPAMFLTPYGGKNTISSIFPQAPSKFEDESFRSVKIIEEADYITKTSGQRAFPWRYFVITDDDKDLITNTMTARLAEPNQLTDTSWIKPGVTTWEWWSGGIPYGNDVDFVAGCNTDTYKYFVDFASAFGIDYVLLDAGWAEDKTDPFTPNEDLDLNELIAYGKDKNVGVILWLPWLSVEKNLDKLFTTYAEWGVKGVKIDHMDRSDQWIVDFYERAAKEAAKNKMFIDFHGSFKPAGLEYKYPNVLTYEGVKGMEEMGKCIPDNSVWFPFIRNAVGPMDYTPGAILTYQPDKYHAKRPNAGSVGTSAYQMALFVLWETGLQMMADNPTLYYQNPEITNFMADVPVVTDVTVPLEAEAGEYAIVAKKKGDKWYIGGITNGKEPVREFEISLDFLEPGKTYTMISFNDGSNAGTQAMHVVKKENKVNSTTKIPVKMVRNGGFAAVIEPS